MKEIPIWEKANLTLEEAAAYSGIGIGKLREITNDKNCNFVLWVGNKRLIKKRLFDKYIEQVFSILEKGSLMWYHKDVTSRLLLNERRSNGI